MSARDRRYTIAREWCGFLRPQHVVRFCDQWVGAAPDRSLAVAIREAHAASRAAQLRAWQADANALAARSSLINARHRAAIARA